MRCTIDEFMDQLHAAVKAFGLPSQEVHNIIRTCPKEWLPAADQAIRLAMKKEKDHAPAPAPAPAPVPPAPPGPPAPMSPAKKRGIILALLLLSITLSGLALLMFAANY